MSKCFICVAFCLVPLVSASRITQDFEETTLACDTPPSSQLEWEVTKGGKVINTGTCPMITVEDIPFAMSGKQNLCCYVSRAVGNWNKYSLKFDQNKITLEVHTHEKPEDLGENEACFSGAPKFTYAAMKATYPNNWSSKLLLCNKEVAGRLEGE